MGLLFIALFFFAFFSEIANRMKNKEIKVKSMIISLLMALLMLVIFKTLYNLNFTPGSKWIFYGLIPVAGVVLGIVSGSATKIEKRGGVISSTGNVWHLMLWGVAIILIQLMLLFEYTTGISVVIALVIFSTALLVADNLLLIIRSSQLK